MSFVRMKDLLSTLIVMSILFTTLHANPIYYGNDTEAGEKFTPDDPLMEPREDENVDETRDGHSHPRCGPPGTAVTHTCRKSGCIPESEACAVRLPDYPLEEPVFMYCNNPPGTVRRNCCHECKTMHGQQVIIASAGG